MPPKGTVGGRDRRSRACRSTGVTDAARTGAAEGTNHEPFVALTALTGLTLVALAVATGALPLGPVLAFVAAVVGVAAAPALVEA